MANRKDIMSCGKSNERTGGNWSCHTDAIIAQLFLKIPHPFYPRWEKTGDDIFRVKSYILLQIDIPFLLAILSRPWKYFPDSVSLLQLLWREICIHFPFIFKILTFVWGILTAFEPHIHVVFKSWWKSGHPTFQHIHVEFQKHTSSFTWNTPVSCDNFKLTVLFSSHRACRRCTPIMTPLDIRRMILDINIFLSISKKESNNGGSG